MRKCLLFVALLMVSQLNILKAQSMFEAPDTVCVRQPIQLISNVPQASTHYWGFCSAYLLNTPTGVNMGTTPYDLDGPTDVEVVKEGDNYYGFVVASNTNEFKRLSFGTSLHNTPVVTNYGNFDNALPLALNSLFVLKDEAEGNWHIFLTGGSNPANSEMARIDFGKSLADTPNIVNFGNYSNVLDAPHGMFIAKESDKWIGFVLNKGSNTIVRMDMDSNISLTPLYTDLGFMPLAQGMHDIAPIRDNGNWYFFVTNEQNNSITRFDIGPSLNITSIPPTQQHNSGDYNGALITPNGITLIRDCDNLHAFITNRTSHELVRIDIPVVSAPPATYSADNLGNIGGLLQPASISKMVRDKDDVFAFIPNFGEGSISKITFAQCTNSSIPFSTTNRPPLYTYNAPGYYNVYYAINEGTPDMKIQCKQIAVLEIPPMEISNDTMICQGDTVMLRALSIQALNVTWSPDFNISATDAIDVKAWPDYTVQYRILFPYRDGCIVDTSIDVTVRKIKADAGPDRTIKDGASTLLGGPFTSTGTQYAYNWKPAQFMDNSIGTHSNASPPYDFTYYLQVTDTGGCVDVDTVVIRVTCDDLHLPNAFVPKGQNERSNTATFGISNYQFVKLNHFRIFDRWGKMVFETTDATKRWDGTVNGEDAATGVYVWEADAFCISGQRIQKSGNVTLIR